MPVALGGRGREGRGIRREERVQRRGRSAWKRKRGGIWVRAGGAFCPDGEVSVPPRIIRPSSSPSWADLWPCYLLIKAGMESGQGEEENRNRGEKRKRGWQKGTGAKRTSESDEFSQGRKWRRLLNQIDVYFWPTSHVNENAPVSDSYAELYIVHFGTDRSMTRANPLLTTDVGTE